MLFWFGARKRPLSSEGYNVSVTSQKKDHSVPLSTYTMLTELVFTLGYNLHWCVLTISLLLHPPAFSYLFVSALAPCLDMCIFAGITLKVSLVVFFIEQMWHFLHLPDSELGGQNVKNNEAKWIWSLNTSLKQCSETFSSQSSLEAVRENSLEAVEWREIWSSC